VVGVYCVARSRADEQGEILAASTTVSSPSSSAAEEEEKEEENVVVVTVPDGAVPHRASLDL